MSQSNHPTQPMQSTWKDHALVLGLTGDRATLTPKIIDDAFKEKQIQWHPDKHVDKDDKEFAHKKYIEAQDARDYLKGDAPVAVNKEGCNSNAPQLRCGTRRSSLDDEPATPPSVLRNISRTEILKSFE
jgi:hypothetical protein